MSTLSKLVIFLIIVIKVLAFYTLQPYCIFIHCINNHVEQNMNCFIDVPRITPDNLSNSDNTLLLPLSQFNQPLYRLVSQQQHMLMQLIKRHQAQAGWIVLLAPSAQLIKQLASITQLPLHKVLVIHKKQLSNVYSVIHTALSSGNCKVVINCSQALTEHEDHQCQKLAVQQQAWFYQLDNLCQRLQPH
jgi:cell division inhibitor SulA